MPIPFYHPQPAPPALFNGLPLPQAKANIFSRMVYQWVTPILKAGYSRPLQAEDLWDLSPELQCQNVANTLEAHFLARLPPSLRHADTQTLPSPQAEQIYRRASQASRSVTLREASLLNIDQHVAVGAGVEVGDEVEEEIRWERRVSIGATEVLGEARKEGEKKRGRKNWIGYEKKETNEGDETDKDEENEKEDAKRYANRKAKKIAQGKLAIEDGKEYDMSLLAAMYKTVWRQWWLATAIKLIGVALTTTTPLVTRIIINQLSLAYAYHQASAAGASTEGLEKPKSIGYGIGLAVGLFAMNFIGDLFVSQSRQIGMIIGFSLRSSLMDLISRKSLRLSGRSKLQFPSGKLTTMLSADVSFLDLTGPASIDLIVQPIQIVIGVGLVIYTLGSSALVGVGILAAAGPVQALMFVAMVKARKEQVKVVDLRVKLLAEVINNIRAVKLYSYEKLFEDKVSILRDEELARLKQNGFHRATSTAVMYFLPIIGAVLTFVTFGLTGHTLDVARVFSGLQFFNILQNPVSILPMTMTAVSDSLVAMRRVGALLKAEEVPTALKISNNSPYGVDVAGDFQFDALPDNHEPPAISTKETEKPPGGDDKSSPFKLIDIVIRAPRGSLVCIVGRVGTGKSALIRAMLNEMRLLGGHVVFGGEVSYVPQQAWVMAGSALDNITFSQTSAEIDHERVQRVVDACGLRADIDMWSDGIQTMIGERGITLSGGQKQRLCLARAAYAKSSPVVLLDDPLSAVDANVAHHLTRNCILSGPFADRTRILVTHHLDVLPAADLVVVMDRDSEGNGRITQQGTYERLLASPGTFRTLMQEFGTEASQERTAGTPSTTANTERRKLGPSLGAPGTKLIMDEERKTGVVSGRVYLRYFQSTGSWWWVIFIVAGYVVTEIAWVGNTLFLGFWSASSISGFTQGDFMAIYASLGLAVAVFMWLDTYLFYLAGIRASSALFRGAWGKVIHSPMSWHDRTPAGRIISRLSKDIEMLDDRLSQVCGFFLANALDAAGSFGLVVYTYPYLGLAFIPLILFLSLCTSFYRQTSREIKRIDSISRSAIYSSFGEQLSGVPVIRAFGQQKRFEERLQHAVNEECKAYIITISIQRWLAVRLDLCSNVLIMLIAIVAAVLRESLNPDKVGVVLTYTLATAAVFATLVSQYAQVEQEMNAMERVQHYNELEVEQEQSEGPEPDPTWPARGEVSFRDVEMRYRPELPLVLKGISFTVRPGHKIGVVGRTGAGKSSLAQALFRTVEISGGSIIIDDVDISKLNLHTLRSRMSIIPQDAFVFAGTVRDNIDPTHARTDEELQDILDAIRSSPNTSQTMKDKFRLEMVVESEGANFSAGEKQLLALFRALARGCRVLLLDEATSSVDPETDALIQRLIRTKFVNATLICIAHRLQTIIGCDRILVMDAGAVAEYDTPLTLYDQEGSIFRSFCDKASLSRQDLLDA